MDKIRRKLKKKNRAVKIEKKNVLSGAELALDVLQVIPVYVLMNVFGFGNTRLERFLKEFFRIYQKVMTGKVSCNTLASEIEMKTGIRIDLATGDVFNTRKDEDDERTS